MQDKNRLEEIIKEMTAVNAKLAGHQNLKQKIHYHQQVKNENVSLKEVVNILLYGNSQTGKIYFMEFYLKGFFCW